MIKQLLLICVGIGLFYCVQSVPAHAQAANCVAPWYCSWYSFDSGCIPKPPEGAFDCDYNGPWAQVCGYVTTSCAPPPCNCGANAGHPINLASGNTFISESDLKVPGLSSGLSLTRTWNSIWMPTESLYSMGLFGPNWRSTYEERLYVGSDKYVKYSRNDGSYWSFAYAGAVYAPVGPSNVTATLTLDTSNTQDTSYWRWTLTFQNGEQRIFNYSGGFLTSIIDRNGNTTQLSYDSLNRLVTVSDPGGRHLYFGYAGNSRLVTGVTSDVGLSLSYSYDGNGLLIQVTKPDQTTMSYVYASNSMITEVKDSDAKILESHTYDNCGRGLTSSRAGGIENVSVSYNAPCWAPAPSQYAFYGYSGGGENDNDGDE